MLEYGPVEASATWTWRRAVHSALVEGSPLSDLAEGLSSAALLRSAAAQEQHAAVASRNAVETDRYPQIVPTATIPIATYPTPLIREEPSVGLAVEQTLYDFGQNRAQLDGADLGIEAKRIEVWAERNATVLAGLSAAIDVARLSGQLAIYRALDRDLRGLGERLETRSAGGVADRGETLRYQSALQQVKSDTIEAETALRAAQASLAWLLSADSPAPTVPLGDAQGMCRRGGGDAVSPSVAMATIALEKSEADGRLVRSQRFPRIVAQAGASMTTSGTPGASFGIRFDTSSMLGLGQNSTIDAHDANIEARRRGLEQAVDDVAMELRQRDMEHEGLTASERQLVELVISKTETLKLFNDQVTAGTLSLTDGISLYREDADARMQLLDIRAGMVISCLHSAATRGQLAAYEVGDE